MKLEEIKKMPTVIDNVHESCYRSYHILRYMKDILTVYSEMSGNKFLLEIISFLEGEE